MKMVALFAAAAAVLSIPAASATGAVAQERVVTRTTTVTHTNHRGGARRAYWRNVCTTKYRHHQRVRTCRKVRAWR